MCAPLADTQVACMSQTRPLTHRGPRGYIWVLAHRGDPREVGNPLGKKRSHAYSLPTPDTGRETMEAERGQLQREPDGEGVPERGAHLPVGPTAPRCGDGRPSGQGSAASRDGTPPSSLRPHPWPGTPGPGPELKGTILAAGLPPPFPAGNGGLGGGVWNVHTATPAGSLSGTCTVYGRL